MTTLPWLLAAALAVALAVACSSSPAAPPAPPRPLTLPPPPTAAAPTPTHPPVTLPPSPTAPAAAPTPTAPTPTPPPADPGAAPADAPCASHDAHCRERHRILQTYGSCGTPESHCRRLSLTPGLTAAAWLDAARMYLADWDGRLHLLNVNTGQAVVVMEGLTVPRGLTVLNGHLYVSDLGNVCDLVRAHPDVSPVAKANCIGLVPGILPESSAQILSYRIDDSGALSDPQVVVDKIPCRDRNHCVNGLTNDGDYVYASIGHPQHCLNGTLDHGCLEVDHPALLAAGRRAALMGTVIRFRPGPDTQTQTQIETETEIEIYATGLRNVYGISIAPDGAVWGADNDQHQGLPLRGSHREELNRMTRGSYHGFPAYGTNQAPPSAGVTEPAAILNGRASTMAYAAADGVYVAYFAFASNAGHVVHQFDYAAFTPTLIYQGHGHTTAILEKDGLLYLANTLGYIYIIDPAVASVIAPPLPDAVRQTIQRADSFHRGPWAVYHGANLLIYLAHSCSEQDPAVPFFLHLYPADPADLPEHRRQYGFDNLDFDPAAQTVLPGEKCLLARQLPPYDLLSIKTGQYRPNADRLWEATLPIAP